MKFDRTTPGHLAALLTIFIWGTTFISTKILLKDFQPIEILLFRFLLGAAALFLVCPRRIKGTSPKQELTLAAAGLCGICLYYLLENIALTYTMASNVGGHSLRCALSDGYPHPLVFAGRRKTAAPFLFRFSGGDRGNLPDQFQWSPVGLESQGGIGWPCWRLLFGPAILF